MSVISRGHGDLLIYINTEVLKYGYRTGLATLVVHTLNYEYLIKKLLKLTHKYSAWGEQSQDLNLKELAGI